MVTAPIESAATVVSGAPVDPATIAVPAIVAATIIGRAIIPAGIKRRNVTGGRVDAGLITTGKRDRKRRKDCAQKNPTANHGFLSLA
jgi:hypothetical protein